MGITPWEAARAPDACRCSAPPARKALGRFMATMQRLRERAEAGTPVGELLQELLQRDGLPGGAARRSGRSRRRAGIENLEELVQRRARVRRARRRRTPSLDEFLQQIALLADADTLRDDEGLVTLMTLHNAKGLEFPIVFIIGCEDGVFPHSRAIDEGNIEEERRLAYVGITRAMRDLTLTYARRRNVVRRRTPSGMRSRFIDEIPRELTDQPDRSASASACRRAGPGRVVGDAAAAARERRPRRRRRPRGRVFRLGDDVVHAAFGEGVVIGVEPGGIVVVRFAGDGSRAQADGRLRADPQALTRGRAPVATARPAAPQVGVTGPARAPRRRRRPGRLAWRPCAACCSSLARSSSSTRRSTRRSRRCCPGSSEQYGLSQERRRPARGRLPGGHVRSARCPAASWPRGRA